MNTVLAGMHRGWVEFRLTVRSASDMLGWLWPSIVAVVIMYVLRNVTVPGTGFSLGAQSIPGILGMNVVLMALMGLASTLTVERTDGTLLRMKATPNGVLGYLTGKVVNYGAMTIASLLLVLAAAGFLFSGLQLHRPQAWLMLTAMVALGLVATLPIGAVLGSLFKNAQSLGFAMLLLTGLVTISGVFYPIGGFPLWLQWVAQVFPVYWLGLGMRSALLPDALAVAEIGQSWRHLETVGVLGLWAVAGFVLAPIVLRRMARRQSGTSIEKRQDSWQ
jgi:ABC-2 type transport system permease protein